MSTSLTELDYCIWLQLTLEQVVSVGSMDQDQVRVYKCNVLVFHNTWLWHCLHHLSAMQAKVWYSMGYVSRKRWKILIAPNPNPNSFCYKRHTGKTHLHTTTINIKAYNNQLKFNINNLTLSWHEYVCLHIVDISGHDYINGGLLCEFEEFGDFRVSWEIKQGNFWYKTILQRGYSVWQILWLCSL